MQAQGMPVSNDDRDGPSRTVREMSSIDSATTRLGPLLDRLEKKLAYVLRPGEPSDVNAVRPHEPGSGMALDLGAFADRLIDHGNRLESIIDRLDL